MDKEITRLSVWNSELYWRVKGRCEYNALLGKTEEVMLGE